MKFNFNGKNLVVTDALKNRTVSKISKLGKFFRNEEDLEVFVTLEVEKIEYIMEVTIPYNNVIFRAEVASDDMYASLDKAVDVLERQIRKNKTRLEKKLRENAFDPSNFMINETVQEEKEFEVKRVKRFPIKPIDVEEAILQMNLLGHQFFVFTNAKTNDVNVVYRRNDGAYGLIEPER